MEFIDKSFNLFKSPGFVFPPLLQNESLKLKDLRLFVFEIFVCLYRVCKTVTSHLEDVKE
jgi:hypothetical protein